MTEKPKANFKVAKFKILKPIPGMSWPQLRQIIRDVQYRVFRLANMAVSEAYLNFHLYRTGKSTVFKTETIGKLSQRLRKMLTEEGKDGDGLDRFSKTGALPDTVVSALSHHKLRAITGTTNWNKVIRGETSLPTFRRDMAIPIRCDKKDHRRLEKIESGYVELDLMICRKPYPRVVLDTLKVDGGQKAVLERLLENTTKNLPDDYRQRCFEIKEDSQTGEWWLCVSYEFPQCHLPHLKPEIVVGVDLGVSVPLYAAINNGYARLGRREFGALGHRIRSLQNYVIARRREIQTGGRRGVSQEAARSGHGRVRKLLPTEKLQHRIENAYTTLNHQLSRAVIDFAKDHGAGTIQVEDLNGLKEQLRGTFIGARWRYYQLQQFIEYKAEENGIHFEKVNPRYTSRRCSQCGFIHKDFDRTYRDKNRVNGKVAKFICPNPDCKYEADPDYNAARNIATLDIKEKIRIQCESQGIDYE